MINLEKLGYFLPQGHLFQNVNLQINSGDKVGLVGKNGAGKSTLLKILSGKLKASEGFVHLPKGTEIGYLTQDIKIDTEKNVFDFLNYSNERLNFIRTRLEDINRELVIRTDYESDEIGVCHQVKKGSICNYANAPIRRQIKRCIDKPWGFC